MTFFLQVTLDVSPRPEWLRALPMIAFAVCFALFMVRNLRVASQKEMLLAVPFDVAEIFDEPLGRLLLEANLVRVISFDPVKEEIVRWIP